MQDFNFKTMKQFNNLGIQSAMKNRSSKVFLIIMLIAFFTSCKKDIVQKTVYDNVIYNIDTVGLYSSNADKTKQKSAEQFISILYSNLTNSTIPGDDLNNIAELSYSFGDKGLINTMLLENILGSPDIQIPTDEDMRNDLDAFVQQTYLKFYLRQPSEYEKYYFKNLIAENTGITPQMVYAAFAQSNEYLFY